MDNIFGLSMNALLIAMLIMLGISLSTVAYVALRNRIMFLMGLRNIPRRVAQTVLIVLGTMLSTVIITAAFTTGDTVDHSITKEILRISGHLDEAVDFESRGDAPSPDIAIPMQDFVALEQELDPLNNPNIDGLTPVLFHEVPVVDLGRRQSAPNARFVGLDPTRLEGFETDIKDLDGNQLDPAALSEDGVFVNESLADELDTAVGSELTVFFNNEPTLFRVEAIAGDRGITGSFGGNQSEGLVTRLDTLQALVDRPNEVNFIAVSNTGDVRGGLDLTSTVEARLEREFEALELPLDIAFTKEENLEQAEAAGAGMLTFFLVFGIFSIASGMLLIVMIFVMLAAERKSELGMARALGTKRSHLVQTFLAEGMGYNLVSALVGTALGVLVAFGLAGILSNLFAGSDFDLAIEPRATPRSLIIAYSIGVVLTFITVVFSSWRVSQLNIVRAIRDLPEPERQPGRRSIWLGLGLSVVAGLLMWAGVSSLLQFPFALGISLAFFASAIFARVIRLPERPVFTTVGLGLLGFWLVNAGELIPGLSELDGDIEMFILSGIVMVAAASFVLVYNADLLLTVVSALGGRFGRLLPAVRTAVAYPLASKFRTGMTMAMISLVVFALTMMSVMNSNFERVFLDEDSLGGWDVEARENASNALDGGLLAALDGAEPGVDTSQFVATASLGIARPFAAELCQTDATDCADTDEFLVYVVKGADQDFLTQTVLPMQARATGYESNEAIWAAIAENPNLAVIDSNALGGDFFDFGDSDFFSLEGIDSEATEFDAIEVIVRDGASGETAPLQIIGVLSLGASGGGDPSASFFGVITSLEAVTEVFGEVEQTNYYVRLTDPDASKDVARDIEAALLETGVESSSLIEDREDATALARGFFNLVQAFAGMGLFVGIAAVGVVAFRSVVERRQQIGMLRAIGYTRGTVAISFLLESAFIALLGVVSGIVLAVLLAQFLLRSDEFDAIGITSVHIPWLRIILVGVFAMVATLVMTYVPSRQAASVPIAEALRYE